jgi:hypothetical protein
VRYFLTRHPDGIQARARAESPELDVVGDAVIDLAPGDDLDGIAYADLDAAADRDGYIDTPDDAAA